MLVRNNRRRARIILNMSKIWLIMLIAAIGALLFTNPDAAIQGIRAMTKPTVLIGGGYDKESSYDEWIEAFEGKVKAFVLIGQTKEKIAACARAHNVQNIIMADTFEEAFGICVSQAKPGDAVLLSPACASWGMFTDYEARGRIFKELVEKIGV